MTSKYDALPFPRYDQSRKDRSMRSEKRSRMISGYY